MSNAAAIQLDAPSASPRRWPLLVGFVVIAALGGVALLATREPSTPPPGQTRPSPPAPSAPNTPASPPSSVPTAPTAEPGNTPPPEVMEVAKAVMVTADLDYGPNMPTIAQALQDIERRYEPTDGKGRTFAILDAYGEPTPDGKLHISMHVSTEKPGRGTIVFKKTGEVLWTTKIEGQPVDLATRNLGIFIDDGRGNSKNIDGSRGPSSILDALVGDLKIPVRDFWPDGQDREVTFIYSACGCPVKTMVKRVGERTMRTTDRPVMFPDDPAAVATISALMKW